MTRQSHYRKVKVLRNAFHRPKCQAKLFQPGAKWPKTTAKFVGIFYE